jgi:hypothetical protein
LVKVGWGFELYLEWDLEVDLDVFEEALMKALPFLPAANGMPSVTLMLLQKGVSHPVTQGSGTGTKAKYLVQAELGRA